ncbi:phenylacetic acid degradation protein PaaY [Mitsuaria sp. WAJ17]|uniref:phenylacetic acid degradation protein PaaY n=1 Tax=Mitsuaria sp. WAJ17 TaxID=2761452 RepID=UPI0016021B52|nr:phenylacetic acid degradation protein PaaY [Mitsuaria sp. WAJ17]MBB2487356.1 phenylacetic acid degradation protein PaaY [Mitsuaria sp. WAJ17]
MPCYAIDGVIPVVHPSAHVHPTAVLIGDVHVGPGCYVGPNASLRGDFGRIVLHEGANVQDCCVIHGFPGSETLVERNGHIGHGAVLHGCVIRHDALVGMKAVVMDGAVLGAYSILAACAFVKAGQALPEKSLIAGLPAKVMRPLGEDEIRWKLEGTRTYQQLSQRCLSSLEEVKPLAEAESNRPALPASLHQPLHASRQD